MDFARLRCPLLLLTLSPGPGALGSTFPVLPVDVQVSSKEGEKTLNRVIRNSEMRPKVPDQTHRNATREEKREKEVKRAKRRQYKG